MSDLPTRKPSAFLINFEQQKKSSKELLKSVHRNDLNALSRFKLHHPKYSALQSSSTNLIKLSDAQLVIARELGLPSWAKLKQHIVNLNLCTEDIQNRTTAPDAGIKTLHIRCGTDLQSTLPSAGFIGDFLEYSEPYCQGPVVKHDDFMSIRANFLYQSYGKYVDKTLKDIETDLSQANTILASAAEQYTRVVLWFEHDSYDQLILARLLAYFAEHDRPEMLELVSINHFPGSVRFIGMGQLPAEAIRLIWHDRKAVSKQQLLLGKKIWQLLREPTPQPLIKLLSSDNIKHLADMHKALMRHLQELPSSFNGLGLTEQLSLEMLEQGPLTAGKLFHRLMKDRDPLPWLGDIMYWHILRTMTKARQPVFIISESTPEKPWHQRLLTITNDGRQLLQGKQDWLAFAPVERYLGGIKISAQHPCWRWNQNTQTAKLGS